MWEPPHQLLTSQLSFALSFKAALIAVGATCLFFILWKKRKLFSEPKMFFPDIALLDKAKSSKFYHLPGQLLSASLICFTIAFTDPHAYLEKKQTDLQEDNDLKVPVEGIGIYLILDQSGSMKETINQKGHSISKIDLLKSVTKEFVEGDASRELPGRPNDMIGLVAFARGAHVLSPLTLDHAALLQELEHFSPIGERDDDGTSIGYAIFKTTNMIAATRHYANTLKAKGKPAYTMNQVVMILITDGLQDPNPLDKGKRLRNMDVPEAAAYAKAQNIRLYIVNVEPKLATEEYAPYRHIMQRAAETTGGKFFMIDNTANLKEIYSAINQIEKSTLPTDLFHSQNKANRPDLYKKIAFYPYLIALGLIFLFVGLMLECTILRRIP